MPERYDAETVKASASLADVVEHYGVKLQRAGAGELTGPCPFHNEKTVGGFTVTPGKGLFHCFSCGASGDVFAFVQRIDGCGFPEAVRRVAEFAGVQPTQDAPPSAPRAESAAPAGNPRVVATYAYRDESGELLYEVLRYEPGRNGKPKDFRQRRQHPMDGAWVWGISAGAYRKSGDSWYPVKGGDGQPDDDELPEVRRVLYRLPELLAADRSETVYVVEGEKDVETLVAAGAVATTNSGGAAQRWLPEYSEAFRGRRVVVIPDADAPGRKKAAEIARALAGVASSVAVVECPSGKDATEFLHGGGSLADIEALLEARAAEAVREERARRGLLSPAEVIDGIDGGPGVFMDPTRRAPGVPTGFRDLDDLTLGLHPGELTILAARPAMGKTALALNIAANAARGGRSSVAVFSLEMASSALLTRLACSEARVNSHLHRAGRLDSDGRRRFAAATAEICGWRLFIDDSASLGMKAMRERLVMLRDAHGLDMVVLDYLQLMAPPKAENRNVAVSALSRGLKIMARDLRVPFLVLSQLSREAEKRPGDHRPQMSDLRDSGGIEQDADNIAFIYRPEVYKPEREDLRGVAEIILAKQRNGPTGKARAVWLRDYTRFEDRAADYVREEDAA